MTNPLAAVHRSICVLTASALVLAVAGCGSSAKTSTSKRQRGTDAVNLLFVQDAARATLRRTNAGKHHYRLTLIGDDHDIEWFTDRPRRDAGRFGVTDMLRTFGWKRSGDRLGATPPNLVINSYDGATRKPTETFVGELISASVNQRDHAISYELRMANGSPPVAANVKLDQVTIFIDPVRAKLPTTSTAPIVRISQVGSGEWSLMARTSVSVYPPTGEYNQVSLSLINSAGMSQITTLLTPQNPTVSSMQVSVGMMNINISDIELTPATADQPGSVYMSMSHSKMSGAGPNVMFSGQVASWTTTGE